MSRRAIGIVRVSRIAGREGERFVSPAEQRSRIEAQCEREGFELVSVAEELDVSGGTPLAEREGLRAAVEAVEAGHAQVIVAAYFDRLVRSLAVQEEVVSRVEAAGGKVLTVDVGQISGATAGQWLSGTVLGAMNEYVRRTARERSGAAQADAVARGVVPFPSVPPGLRINDGRVEADESIGVVREAFEMRARGETLKAIRAFLREHGIQRSYHGVSAMFGSRLYLGEIHFGKLVNLAAHEPLIERDLWKAAQAPPRAARPKSKDLLARLGVLRCATCDARMVAGSSHHGTYRVYRCPSTGDCPRRVAISADIAERAVVSAVLAKYGRAQGRASAVGRAQRAAEAADKAQADLDAAIRAFGGLEEEPAARERLAELTAARDEAREEAEHLRSLHATSVLELAGDWERLSVEGRRGVIRAAVVSAVVAPGRGDDRVSVTLR